MTDPLSPGYELVLKAYRQPLCDRIHLENCILLDNLQSTQVLTREEAEVIQVRYIYYAFIIEGLNHYVSAYLR